MRYLPALLMIVAATTSMGCFTSRAKYALYSVDHKITANEAYDADLQAHLAGLPRGGHIAEENCETALLGLIPYPPGMRLIPSNEELLEDALAQAGPGYDAVVEAEWALRQEIFWPFHRRICTSIEGEAVRNAPYRSGSRFESRR